MNGALFSLVNKEHGIFAWGLEVTVSRDPETGEEVTSALVYRPAMNGEQFLISVHDSAESAHGVYRRMLPVDLRWEADRWHEEMLNP